MKDILIHCTNHYDILWRRPFDRDFYYDGQRYISGADIEEMGLDSWLEMAEKTDLKFDVECVWTVRKYLERHPEKKPLLKRLYDEKKFELLGAGLLIPDTNLPNGETLVRNLLYGFLWAKQTLGEEPEIGILQDSFGCSAQMPQLYRKCGVRWVTGLSYSYPTRDYWRGLDGSTVYIQQFFNKGMRDLGPGNYYAPCDACHGKGCAACGGRGVNPFVMTGNLEEIQFPESAYPYNVIRVGGEESISTPELPDMVARANQAEGGARYRFATPRDMAEYHAEDIARVDSPDPERVSPEVEGGPNSSGTLVSRIKIKQRLRALENRLIPLEKLCTLLYTTDSGYPEKELRQLWEDAVFASFHDSVTGTHVDPGYAELMETFDRAELVLKRLEEKVQAENFEGDSAISVFNSTDEALTDIVTVTLPCKESVAVFDENGEPVEVYGCRKGENGTALEFQAKDVPALGIKTYTWKARPILDRDERRCLDSIENDFFKISADTHGIYSIYDKQHQTELIDLHKGYANELILEQDVGDPWATREHGRERTRLGMDTVLESAVQRENYAEMVFTGTFSGNGSVWYPRDYRVMKLKWKQTVRLYNGIRRIDFKTEIDWDTFDRRIRVSFPTNVNAAMDHGAYAVPYGVVSRDRYEFSRTGWNNANGDYPALEWFSTTGDGVNVAVMNRGTPCARIENGEILVSVLRSPTFPNCLFWPEFYNAPVYDGMRDYGAHSFEYALTDFSGDWKQSDIVRQAEAYNQKLLCVPGTCNRVPMLFSLDCGSTRVSSMKKSEDGSGVIVRLAEWKGQEDHVVIRLPQNCIAVQETNLLEKSVSEPEIPAGGYVSLDLHGFEIKTLKLQISKKDD